MPGNLRVPRSSLKNGQFSLRLCVGKCFYDLFISENAWILHSALFLQIPRNEAVTSFFQAAVGRNSEFPGAHSMGGTEDLAMLGSCSAEHGCLLSAPLPSGLWGYWSGGKEQTFLPWILFLVLS